jgi:hypothetical protein
MTANPIVTQIEVRSARRSTAEGSSTDMAVNSAPTKAPCARGHSRCRRAQNVSAPDTPRAMAVASDSAFWAA